MKQQSGYNASVKKLRTFLEAKEIERQKWANEKWSHEGGNWFKISKVLVPLMSVIGLCMVMMMCVIRYVKMPDVYNSLIAGEIDTKEPDSFLVVFFVLCFIALAFLVYSNIRLFTKKYRIASFSLAGSSLAITLLSIIRFAIDKNNNVFPDNSNYETMTSITFYEICTACAVLFAILFFFSLIMISIYVRDKIELNRIVERTLINMVPSKKDLLEESDYIKLIDEYIASENEKTKERQERKKKKK